MSDTIESSRSLAWRVWNTPMRDVVRGRLSGRLDVRARVAASGLPAPVQALVLRVVKKTRLWRLEKVHVADELIAHFADGLDAGASADELVARFGDVKTAARLIRRAKVRCRPVAWHLLRGVRWLASATLVFYAALAVVFFSGRPTVAVNYVAEMNRPILATPLEQRGWPVYRDAILVSGRPWQAEEKDNFLDATPRSKRWPELAQWVAANQKTVELAREGAKRPMLGFVLGEGGAAHDPELWPNSGKGTDPDGMDRDFLIAVLLPHLGDMRGLANVLAADARVAREAGDAPRLLADVRAMLAMARQLRTNEKSLITDLVSLAIRTRAVQVLGETLAHRPQLLGDGDLQALAHELCDVRTSADLLSVEGEAMTFRDLLQRTYTDDGHGDGRMTPRGLRLLGAVTSVGNESEWGAASRLLGPGTVLITASRREMEAAYDRAMAVVESNLRKPIREADWGEYERIVRESRDGLNQIRHTPLAIMLPALNSLQRRGQTYLSTRDALTAAMAAELHRRRTGTYPQTLEELVPAALPQVPEDPMDGRGLRYRLVDGKPLVYSVGADRDDDGGRRPAPPRRPQRGVDEFDAPPHLAADADWVLYPPKEAEDRDGE